MHSQPESILTIVIPVYNEASVLEKTIQTIVPYATEKGWELIFVDDGSTDHSNQILAQLVTVPPVRVLRHKINRGYGAALKTGISCVQTPYVVTFDADGQHQIQDVERILNFAIQNDSDLVVGNRQGIGNKNLYRALGKWIIWQFACLLMPLKVRDLNSGFKLYKTKLIHKYLTFCPNSMAFSDVITLIFTHQRHIIHEIPISVSLRPAGKSTINTWTAFETLLEILNAIIMLNPLKIFIPLSLLSIIVGVSWGVYLLIRVGRGVSVGSMLAVVSGLIFFMLGLLAHQIANLRLDLIEYKSEAKTTEQNDSE